MSIRFFTQIFSQSSDKRGSRQQRRAVKLRIDRSMMVSAKEIKRVAIYYRVSTRTKVADGDGDDPEAVREKKYKQDYAIQSAAIKDFLIAKNIDPKTAAVYKDRGSGKNTRRPEFQKMLEHARHGRFDNVVVYKLDRFARRADDAINTIIALEESGVGFISVTQPALNLDTSNPLRRTILSLFAELAQIERQTIVDRVRAGLENAKKKGKVLGRPKKYDDVAILDVIREKKAGRSLRVIAKRVGMSKTNVERILDDHEKKSKKSG